MRSNRGYAFLLQNRTMMGTRHKEPRRMQEKWKSSCAMSVKAKRNSKSEMVVKQEKTGHTNLH